MSSCTSQSYNASNNELVRTNTLVKSSVVQIDATPFRQWYETHYAQPLSAKTAKLSAPVEEKKLSNHATRVLTERKADSKLDAEFAKQFTTGKVLAMITSRPGQSGRCDGYLLEGAEYEFYRRKM